MLSLFLMMFFNNLISLFVVVAQYNRIKFDRIEVIKMPTKTIQKIGNNHYEIRTVSEPSTKRALGKIPIIVPNPNADNDTRLVEFCAIIEDDFDFVLQSYVNGAAVLHQAKARQIASNGENNFTESDYVNFCNELSAEDLTKYTGKAEELRKDAKADWLSRQSPDDVYNENYLFKNFLKP
jgi:hypothetical protein